MSISFNFSNIPWDLYLFAGLFILAGTMHFVIKKFFLRIIPPWVPFPNFVNYSSGFVEILLGLMLFPIETRSLGAWGLFALLIAVWPANIYHYTSFNRKIDPPKWVLLLRLPLQIPLLLWAYRFT
jgi:uncharacterized membrane protein